MIISKVIIGNCFFSNITNELREFDLPSFNVNVTNFIQVLVVGLMQLFP